MRIALALLVTTAALVGCAPDLAEIASCRKQFAEHRQTLAEKGNPGRKAFTPTMTAQWDALYAGFGKLGKTATADDCPDRFTAMSKEIKDLEAVLHKIDDYDVDRMTRRAEAQIDHDGELRTFRYTDYVLVSLFNRLNESGAAAQETLAPLVAAADSAKGAGRGEAMVVLYNAAASNAAFSDFEDALATIEDYEPRDE